MQRYRLALLVPAFLLLSGFVGGVIVAHDLTGRWTLSVVTANGTGTPTVEFKQEGEKLTGTYLSNALGSRSLEGTVVGDTMRFVLSMSGGAGEGVVLTYIARIVTADSLNGYVDFGGMGEASLTGTRVR